MVDLMTLIEISRPGWWIITVWMYLAPTGQHLELFHTARFWFGLFFVAFPLNIVVYGLNDLADIEEDKDNPRKGNFWFGAKRSENTLKASLKVAAVLNLVCVIILSCMVDFDEIAPFLAVYVVSILTNVCYNCEPLRFSAKCPFEIPTITLGFACVSVLSSLINGIPQASTKFWIFHIFQCITATMVTQTWDVEDDAKFRRTTAVLLGKSIAVWATLLAAVVQCLVTFYWIEDWIIRAIPMASVVTWTVADLIPYLHGEDKREKKSDDRPKVSKFSATNVFHHVIMSGIAIGGIGLAWSNGTFVN